jgi:branched-chain amino acid transport system permease protein
LTLSLIVQLLLNGLMFGGLLALVALGLALIFGVMRIVNFAHGVFITLGAYVTYFSVSAFGLSPLVGLPIAMAVGAMLGLVVEQLVIRQLAGRPDLDGLMATYALSIVGLGLFTFAFGGDFRNYSAGPHGALHLAGAAIGWRNVIVLILCTVLTCAVALLLGRSRTGLALRALAQNRESAAACGLNVRAAERLVFAGAALLAAAAGSLLSLIGTTTPELGQQWLLSGFVVVVLGGMGSVAGAALGGLAIGLAQSVAGYLTDDSWAQILTFLLLYACLLLRPRGLLGQGSAI